MIPYMILGFMIGISVCLLYSFCSYCREYKRRQETMDRWKKIIEAIYSEDDVSDLEPWAWVDEFVDKEKPSEEG